MSAGVQSVLANWDLADDWLLFSGAGLTDAFVAERYTPASRWRGQCGRVRSVVGAASASFWYIFVNPGTSQARYARWRMAIRWEQINYVTAATVQGPFQVRCRDAADVNLGNKIRTIYHAGTNTLRPDPGDGGGLDTGEIPLFRFPTQWIVLDWWFSSEGAAQPYDVQASCEAWLDLGSRLVPIGGLKFGSTGRTDVYHFDTFRLGFETWNRAADSCRFLVDECAVVLNDAIMPTIDLPPSRRVPWPRTTWP